MSVESLMMALVCALYTKIHYTPGKVAEVSNPVYITCYHAARVAGSSVRRFSAVLHQRYYRPRWRRTLVMRMNRL